MIKYEIPPDLIEDALKFMRIGMTSCSRSTGKVKCVHLCDSLEKAIKINKETERRELRELNKAQVSFMGKDGRLTT